MKKKLEVIQTTRRGHTCRASGCGKRIPGRMPAIALIHEEVIDGKTERFIAYFCDIGCYNEYESSIIYAGGAAGDEGDDQLVFG